MVQFPLCAARRNALRCLFGTRTSLAPQHARLGPQVLSARHAGQQLRWTSHETSNDWLSNDGPSSDGSAASDTAPQDENQPQSTESPVTGPETMKPFTFIRPSPSMLRLGRGQKVVICGFLGKRREKSKVTFCPLDIGSRADIQIVSTPGDELKDIPDLHDKFRGIPAHSSVRVTGILKERPPKSTDGGRVSKSKTRWDVQLTNVELLNEFPKDIIVSKDAVWPLSARHLQMRFDPLLRDRLFVRSKLSLVARNHLDKQRFHEFETPVLFKSTPEGAREFIVPTRRPGLAYALPQSPQQYKQILMAGGMMNYFQFARCFRDEDSRADRQPEFTQLDIETSFPSQSAVMTLVEGVMRSMFEYLGNQHVPRQIDGTAYDTVEALVKQYGRPSIPDSQDHSRLWPRFPKSLPKMAYREAMLAHGSDKPDMRNRFLIRGMSKIVPEEFVRTITKLEKPAVEAVRFRLNGSPAENLHFIREFMDNLPRTSLDLDPASTPGIFVYDGSKPLNGLAAFGHEGAEKIEALYAGIDGTLSDSKLEHGDLLVVHARKRQRFAGEGWTDLGRLRKAIYDAAVKKGLLKRDLGFRFIWINKFPLFTPDDQRVDAGEGQRSLAGIKATHHPFTAPLYPQQLYDSEDPLLITADHYDLVLNGVEIGGGSRRIHDAAMQEHVFKEVLKMPPEAMGQFDHLLAALRSGCPPHAGFALGWDRFLTMLFDVESVRDVIPFPKNQKGEDLVAKSPSLMTAEQLATYHLALKRS